MNAYLNKKVGFLFFLLAIFLIVTVVPGQAQTEKVSRQPVLLLSADEMEATWDSFFAEEMPAYGVHGAVMVAVRGDQIIFSKGYGYADAERKIPMDPKTTILRSGSIAKTLTATAVFQLSEQGKLDMDTDINQYITKIKIPGTYPEPVTARHLVNMTGGFDTRAIGIRAASREEIIPLEEYLAERLPRRVLPPGRYRRYNDHELVLAGYLVQVVSGMAYEDYIQKYIFEPLEMKDSTVYLPDELLDRAARGYPVDGGAQDAYPNNYYYLNTAPGAGFNTTAEDMAKYMIAHLQLGAYTRKDGTIGRILQEGTTRELHRTGFSHHPLLQGQANSFDEMFFNGQRYLRKFGGAPGMQNSLVLLPGERMGFYLFTNTDGTALRNQWTQRVVETYLNGPPNTLAKPSPVAMSNGDIDMNNYSGSYLEVSDQTSHTTIVKVQALLDPDLWLEVERAPLGGSLQVGSDHLIPTEPTLFRNATNGGYTSFELEKDGKARFLFLGRFVYQRVSPMETPRAQLAILGVALSIFLISALVAVASLLRRKSNGSLLAGMVSALNIIYFFSLVIVLLPVATGGNIWQFSLEPSITLRAVLTLPLVTICLTLVMLVKTILDWQHASTHRGTRLLNVLVLAGMGVFVTFLHTWNLLGWRF